MKDLNNFNVYFGNVYKCIKLTRIGNGKYIDATITQKNIPLIELSTHKFMKMEDYISKSNEVLVDNPSYEQDEFVDQASLVLVLKKQANM